MNPLAHDGRQRAMEPLFSRSLLLRIDSALRNWSPIRRTRGQNRTGYPWRLPR
jgi:hypothetical protein